MKKLTKNLFLLALIFTLASIAPAKGSKYVNKMAKMSLVFPGQYEVENTEDDFSTTKISCKESNIVYYASFTVHTETLTDQVSLCETSLESFTETLGGTITNRSDWRIAKTQGIKAMIDMTDQETRLEYRVVIIGQIQYQFAVISTKSDWKQSAADAFMKSIKLKK